MENLIFDKYKNIIADRIQQECAKHIDPSHDFLHVQRVVRTAFKLALTENADLNIVLPAAYLHDIVIIPKNDPRRTQASRLSAEEAIIFLQAINYPENYLPAIHHAIAAHSFSAKIPAETMEAKIVQDADRLDGIGAIGIARCFSLGGVLSRTFYSDIDPFATKRSADDSIYTLDHFYIKLLKVHSMLQTKSGKIEGEKRLKFMNDFLNQLQTEISTNDISSNY